MAGSRLRKERDNLGIFWGIKWGLQDLGPKE